MYLWRHVWKCFTSLSAFSVNITRLYTCMVNDNALVALIKFVIYDLLLFCTCVVFLWVILHRVHKKVSQKLFAIIVKLFPNFHQIWQVAAEISAEQYLLKLHFTWRVYTHYLVMLRETESWQNVVISHNFQQKTRSRSRTNSYLPEISCWDKRSVYFVKVTLPMWCTQYSRLFIDSVTPDHASSACAVQQWPHYLTACVKATLWTFIVAV